MAIKQAQPKRKAANGEGTIETHKDGKRHRAIISVGVVDGKRKREYGSWRDTKREANADRRTMLHERASGIVQRRGLLTLGQFIEQWLTDVAKPTVRYTTWRVYCSRMDVVRKAIGHIQLKKVTAQDVQSVLSRMSEGAYSDGTVYSTRNILISVLNIAEQWDLVPRNVAKRTKVAPIGDVDRPVLNTVAVKRLLLATLGTPLYVGIHLGILGLRSGEACAIRWQDVDWDQPAISIRGTRVYAPGGVVTGPTKTPRSTRTIPLPAVTAAALRTWQDEQTRHGWAGGDRWEATDAILTNRSGRHMARETLNHRFHLALVEAGLPRMRFHDLRHSSASLMASGGVPIHDRMGVHGHTDVAMAMRYTHGDEDGLRAAVDVLGRILTLD